MQKKKDGLQALLCDTKHADSGLVSNFHRAIQLHSKKDGAPQLEDYNTMEVIVYARYLFERMDLDNKQMVHMFTKQLGQGIDIGLLVEVEHLIWMLIQIRHRLKLSSIGHFGVQKEDDLVKTESRFDPKLNILVPRDRYNNGVFAGLDSMYTAPGSNRTAMLTSGVMRG